MATTVVWDREDQFKSRPGVNPGIGGWEWWLYTFTDFASFAEDEQYCITDDNRTLHLVFDSEGCLIKKEIFTRLDGNPSQALVESWYRENQITGTSPDFTVAVLTDRCLSDSSVSCDLDEDPLCPCDETICRDINYYSFDLDITGRLMKVADDCGRIIWVREDQWEAPFVGYKQAPINFLAQALECPSESASESEESASESECEVCPSCEGDGIDVNVEEHIGEWSSKGNLTRVLVEDLIPCVCVAKDIEDPDRPCSEGAMQRTCCCKGGTCCDLMITFTLTELLGDLCFPCRIECPSPDPPSSDSLSESLDVEHVVCVSCDDSQGLLVDGEIDLGALCDSNSKRFPRIEGPTCILQNDDGDCSRMAIYLNDPDKLSPIFPNINRCACCCKPLYLEYFGLWGGSCCRCVNPEYFFIRIEECPESLQS